MLCLYGTVRLATIEQFWNKIQDLGFADCAGSRKHGYTFPKIVGPPTRGPESDDAHHALHSDDARASSDGGQRNEFRVPSILRCRRSIAKKNGPAFRSPARLIGRLLPHCCRSSCGHFAILSDMTWTSFLSA